ncbi:MAG: hypothetical protein WD207_08925 [Xanthobacteraceae bacterium]
MRDNGNFDPFQVMQRTFTPSFAFGPVARENAAGFWASQAKILASMEDYANGWFERRHAGTEEALASARQICDAATPFDAVREYQKWAIGSVERVIKDGLACQQQLIELGRLGAEPLAHAAETVRAEAESVAASAAATSKQHSRARAA